MVRQREDAAGRMEEETVQPLLGESSSMVAFHQRSVALSSGSSASWRQGRRQVDDERPRHD